MVIDPFDDSSLGISLPDGSLSRVSGEGDVCGSFRVVVGSFKIFAG